MVRYQDTRFPWFLRIEDTPDWRRVQRRHSLHRVLRFATLNNKEKVFSFVNQSIGKENYLLICSCSVSSNSEI